MARLPSDCPLASCCGKCGRGTPLGERNPPCRLELALLRHLHGVVRAQDVEDSCHDVLCRLLRRARRETLRNPLGLCHKIARDLVTTYWRTKSKAITLLDPTGDDGEMPGIASIGELSEADIRSFMRETW